MSRSNTFPSTAPIQPIGAEVSLKNLCKHYGPMSAVDKLSVTIKRGEFFTILGSSGSGKTTTLMMIAGFVYPSSGEILIDEKSVASLPPQKRGLGMVFQNYAVFPHLSVYQNIAFPLKVRKVPEAQIKKQVGEMLDLVQLNAFADRKSTQLSGGQQQRVALARALVFKPSVLLMDEPLGALDKKLREDMQHEIRHIHNQLHVTMIYVTHDQEEALTMSDRIAIMRNGKIEQLDSPVDMYESPKTKFVAEFLGESNFIDAIAIGESNAGMRFRTSGGLEILSSSASGFKPGQEVICAIRPEKISMPSNIKSDHNNWPGIVEDIIYVGDTTRYEVRNNSGLITFKMQNRQSVERPVIGSNLTLGWAASDTKVFPRS